jgi:ribose transport system substrate-binding protein
MRTLLLSSLLVIMPLVAAESAMAKPLTIGWVQGNASLQAGLTIRSGFLKYVEDNKITDWNVTYLDSKGSAELVASNIQDAVARGSDVIFVQVADLRSSSAALSAAAKANIPVLTIGSGVVNGNIVDITSNDWSMSSDVSAALLNKMNGKGNLVILTADSIQPVRARADALRAVLKEFPNVKVIEDHSLKSGDFYQDAMNTMQDIATRYGSDIGGVWTGWDEPAQAAVSVLKKAGLGSVPVSGMDGLPFALEAVCNPESAFYVTSSQEFATWGARIAEFTHKIANGEDPKMVNKGMRTSYTPTHLLTKESCPSK